MYKYLVAVCLFVAMVSVPVGLPAQPTLCFGQPYGARPYAKEIISVGATATPLTTSAYLLAATSTTRAHSALLALLTVETANIRVYYDGSTPTATQGHLIASGTTFSVCGSIPKFKMIAASGTASVTVSYYY